MDVRLAMLAPSLRGGGLEKLVHDLAVAAASDGVRCAVFTVNGLGTYAQDLRDAGVDVFDCSEGRLRIRGLPIRLIRALRDFRPTVIHAHSGTWLPAAVAKRFLGGARLIFTDHGRYPPEPRSRAIIECWCARQTDLLVAVSPALAEYLGDYLALDDLPKVIPNGVDLDRYGSPQPNARRQLRDEWGIGAEDVVAVSVGRLTPVKNHAVLLEAFSKLEPKSAQAQLLLIGKGPLGAALEEQAELLGIARRVHFLGFRRDIPRCLEASDIFVLPSQTEGMPLALIEAMASGLPVIASAVGGIPDILGAERPGFLVPAGDSVQLAEAMQRLVESPAVRVELGQKARERSGAFGFDRFCRVHIETYRAMSLESLRVEP